MARVRREHAAQHGRKVPQRTHRTVLRVHRRAQPCAYVVRMLGRPCSTLRHDLGDISVPWDDGRHSAHVPCVVVATHRVPAPEPQGLDDVRGQRDRARLDRAAVSLAAKTGHDIGGQVAFQSDALVDGVLIHT